MPDFIYYAIEHESLSIFKAILEQTSVKVIPNINFDVPQPCYIDIAQSDFDAFRKVNRRFYLAGDFSVEPPRMRQVKDGKYAGTYTIDNTRFGPLLELSCPLERRIPGSTGLVFGELYCPPTYWSDENRCKVKTPDATFAAFKLIVHAMKRRLISHDSPERVWISPTALELFQSGQVKLLYKGAWLSANGNRIPIYGNEGGQKGVRNQM